MLVVKGVRGGREKDREVVVVAGEVGSMEGAGAGVEDQRTGEARRKRQRREEVSFLIRSRLLVPLVSIVGNSQRSEMAPRASTCGSRNTRGRLEVRGRSRRRQREG